jgi:predicted amidohydrolase/regulation of enolase protein 1 (concanavalin A-like superfamily)
MRLGHSFSILRHFCFLAGVLLSTTGAHAQEMMPAASGGWTTFAARPAAAPATAAISGGSGYTLEIRGNGVPSVYGGWRTRISGLAGGSYYRFVARVVAAELESPRESIAIVLRWRGVFGDEVAPDYVWQHRTQADGSLLFDRTLSAPAGTTAVDIELALQWDSNARLAFDALSFQPAPARGLRPVKVAAVSYRPSGTSSGLESVERAAQYGEQVAAAQRPDVMLFGELLNVIGAPGTYDAKAEAVPGPSTDVMANLARAYSVNVAFGMLEREGGLLYNTAVLINRSGEILGKYRKNQLPLSEVSVGITPGNGVPVFDTDFGRVALLICQDTAFPELAREAAIRGAELILHPIWGGKSSLVAARAVEQSMFIAASGYDYYSEVVDPLGRVLDRVESLNQADAAVATIDLKQRFREEWIGDWRDTSNKQRRIGVYNATEPPEPGDPPPPPPPSNTPPSVSLTAPANNTSYVAPATVDLAASAFDSDGSVARVEFLNGTAVIASDTTAPYAFTWSNVPAGTYTLSARAVDNGNLSAASASVTITITAAPPPPPPPSLPSPWQTQDIGAVGAVGAASASNGTFTVEGAGADVWGTADAFRYAYQPISGDVDVIARVTSIEYVHDWVKAGVMIRERLTADSAHAFMIVTPGVKGVPFQRRTVNGGSSTSTSSGAGTSPTWVKLERRGNTITAFRSTDGASWTLVGSDTFAMPSDVYVGLAVSSHSTSEAATVTFDNVRIVSATAPPPNSAPAVALTSPANGATFTAPANITLTATASDSDGTVTRVDFYAGATLLGSATSSPYTRSWTNVPAGTYSLVAQAIDNAGAVTTSSVVSFTVSDPPPPPPGLPSPWQSQDIGAVGVSGSASASGSTFTLRGAGADVWGTADAFHYMWRPLNGDGDIVARVTSAEYVHDWVKSGVMIRERLTADSPHAFMFVTPGIKGFAFQRRTAAGGLSMSTSGGAGTPPAWVKLERRGNLISAYRSADGVTWTLVGSDTFSMGPSVYVGLAVSSHDTTRAATVTFDGVTVR